MKKSGTGRGVCAGRIVSKCKKLLKIACNRFKVKAKAKAKAKAKGLEHSIRKLNVLIMNLMLTYH